MMSSRYKNLNRRKAVFFYPLFLLILTLVPTGLSGGELNARLADNVSPDSTISILFGGDVTLSNHFERHVGNRYDYPFKKMPWFGEADISMINLENPLTRGGIPTEKKFNFRALPAYTKVLQNGGIDLVTLANNHIFDYSEEGLFDTFKYLDSADIKYVGAGKNLAAARKPALFKIKDLNIAFLGYYGLGKHSDSHPATKEEPGSAMRYLPYIRNDIKKIRDSVDVIIVNFHWGRERQNYPDPEQIDFAHKTIDYGADLIIGHHPHVLQGIERYKGKVIAYSLGNFIFGGNSRKSERSLIIKATIPANNPGDIKVSPIPIQIDYWQPYKLNGSDAEALILQLKEYSAVFPESIF